MECIRTKFLRIDEDDTYVLINLQNAHVRVSNIDNEVALYVDNREVIMYWFEDPMLANDFRIDLAGALDSYMLLNDICKLFSGANNGIAYFDVSAYHSLFIGEDSDE